MALTCEIDGQTCVIDEDNYDPYKGSTKCRNAMCKCYLCIRHDYCKQRNGHVWHDGKEPKPRPHMIPTPDNFYVSDPVKLHRYINVASRHQFSLDLPNAELFVQKMNEIDFREFLQSLPESKYIITIDDFDKMKQTQRLQDEALKNKRHIIL